MNTLGRWLRPQDILLGVDTPDTAALFDRVGEHLARESGLSQQYIAHCLFRREQAASTALGAGVALPHARIEGLREIHALYVRPTTPIDFRAPDRLRVTDVLVLLVPNPAAQEHLDLLADAARLFSNPSLRGQLHATTDRDRIARLLAEGE